MTASELKYQIEQSGHAPYFFCRKTMRFFGDTMRNYGVRKATLRTHSGDVVECYELYRRRPVKHGLDRSAYFACDTFEQRFGEVAECPS